MKTGTVLHVTHSWGGGIAHWVDQFSTYDSEHRHLRLTTHGFGYSHGRILRLWEGHSLLQSWHLKSPIATIATQSDHYDSIVAYVLENFGVGKIMVSSLIGHSTSVLDTGTPTTVIVHDFFPICTALRAFHKSQSCSHCDLNRFRECLENNPFQFQFEVRDPEEYENLRQKLLQLYRKQDLVIVAPSNYASNQFFSLTGVRPDVIPHGIPIREPLPNPTPGSKLRCVVLGRLDREKGLSLFQDIWPSVRGFCEMTFLGAGVESAPGLKGVEIVPNYHPDNLRTHLAKIQPHVGLLFSMVPETFSYTLSELMQFHIPPVATSLGSFSERIVHGKTGHLVSPDPLAIIQTLKEMNENPGQLQHVRNELGKLNFGTIEDMVSAYHDRQPVHPGLNLTNNSCPASAGWPLATFIRALPGALRKHMRHLFQR